MSNNCRRPTNVVVSIYSNYLITDYATNYTTNKTDRRVTLSEQTLNLCTNADEMNQGDKSERPELISFGMYAAAGKVVGGVNAAGWRVSGTMGDRPTPTED